MEVRKIEEAHIDMEAFLTKRDMHCLTRILQGCLYTEEGMFGCCRYCSYQEGCNKQAQQGKTYFTETVTQKLQGITGVYLGINTHNLKEKLLVNSFQSTSKCENMQ